MDNHNRLTKIFASILILVLICIYCGPSLNVYAKAKKNRVIVSMGDSYSSGEGVPPFWDDYDTYMMTGRDDRTLAEKVGDDNWLAHRSIWAWSGQLALPETGIVNLTANSENPSWYFVASSGATTQNIIAIEQNKPYSNGGFQSNDDDPPKLPKQIEIFSKLKEKGITPDYVTLTIGGNDANFSKIVTSAALSNYYFSPCLLSAEFAEVWTKFYFPGGIKDDLNEVYKTINENTGNDTCILVAGYPQLFNPLGGNSSIINTSSDDVNPAFGCLFSIEEAVEIDAQVSLFNKAIENIVKKCKNEGMNIEFVSVEEAFYGHGAYSEDPFINPVIFKSRPDDLVDSELTSAYSIHPNIKGIDAYRNCVQHAINVKEGLPDDWINSIIETSDPTDITTETTIDSTQTPSIDMDVLYAAYRDVLVDYESEMRKVENMSGWGDTKSCALTDVTGDGFPELVILYCTNNDYMENYNGDHLVFADTRIYTVFPEETSATEILHIPKVVVDAGAGTFSNVILLNNGNIVFNTYWGDELSGMSYIEYSLIDNVFQQVNILEKNQYLVSSNPWETGLEYLFNGEEISELDFEVLYNDYKERFATVLVMNPQNVTHYDNVSDWGKAVADTKNNILTFDEAWIILNITPSDEDAVSEYNSYYVDLLAGWWKSVGHLGMGTTSLFKFTENEREKYIYNEDGSVTFVSSDPVEYVTTPDGSVKVIFTDSDRGLHYILDNDTLWLHWDNNGYSGTDSLTRVKDYDGIIIN